MEALTEDRRFRWRWFRFYFQLLLQLQLTFVSELPLEFLNLGQGYLDIGSAVLAKNIRGV